jgi:hypothetical protein
MMNLLIAVLSTEHAKVEAQIEKEFNLKRASLLLTLKKEVASHHLPPPLNLLQGFRFVGENYSRRVAWICWLVVAVPILTVIKNCAYTAAAVLLAFQPMRLKEAFDTRKRGNDELGEVQMPFPLSCIDLNSPAYRLQVPLLMLPFLLGSLVFYTAKSLLSALVMIFKILLSPNLSQTELKELEQLKAELERLKADLDQLKSKTCWVGHIPDEIIADAKHTVLREIFNNFGEGVDFVASRKVTETDCDSHGHSQVAPGGNKPQKSWAFVVFKREEDQAELVASVSNGNRVCVPADRLRLRESANAAELDVKPLNEELYASKDLTSKDLSLLSQLQLRQQTANDLQHRMDAVDDRIEQLKAHNEQPAEEKKHKRFRSATEDFMGETAQEQASSQRRERAVSFRSAGGVLERTTSRAPDAKPRQNQTTREVAAAAAPDGANGTFTTTTPKDLFKKLWPEDERFDVLRNIVYQVFDDVEPTADPRADPSHLNVKSQTRWLCQHSLFSTKHQDAALIKTQELEAKILKLENNISEELKKMDAKLDRNFEAMLAAIAQQGQPAIPPPN